MITKTNSFITAAILLIISVFGFALPLHAAFKRHDWTIEEYPVNFRYRKADGSSVLESQLGRVAHITPATQHVNNQPPYSFTLPDATKTNRQCIYCDSLCTTWSEHITWNCVHTLCNRCLGVFFTPYEKFTSLSIYPGPEYVLEIFSSRMNILHTCDECPNGVCTEFEEYKTGTPQHQPDHNTKQNNSGSTIAYIVPVVLGVGALYVVYQWWQRKQQEKPQPTPPAQPPADSFSLVG